LNQWLPDVADEKVVMAIVGSLSNLGGDPHGMDERLLASVNVGRSTISTILKKLKG
jgi:hypothetical protein